MYLNDNESKVIDTFCSNMDLLKKNLLVLQWKNGSIMAKFDTCFEDDNDEDGDLLEEFFSFGFEFVGSEGNPPIGNLNPGDLFLINYHNFPDAILLNGEKIS